ncbi:MAG: hypothetical protein PHF56_06035 [Desulfuromonadaceae bacterium]|nr:hypothetical protein [Desulfuromonadaceae bacterium]MDD2733481.1 hypothetical protein [Desulfuromonadaceae bacterium]MDD5104349.1 hypothetical protein [Desulfuromonadaceae bacterium]MDD5104358.1 hypothetical protein [Desulfuromonadaceae bacterium]
MNKVLCLGVAVVALSGTLAGCGGGGGGGTTAGTSTVSGVVADGYLRNAELFMDLNGNYQWDAGEPKTVTGQGGAYHLDVAPDLVGRYPIVVRAIAGQTVDEDHPSSPIANSYILCAPSSNTAFISPMSTLIQQKLAGNPGMTMADAMIQLRNQLNLPVGTDMFGNYVSGSQSGQYAANYQTMYQVATQMADLMAQQAPLVMTGTGVNLSRYQAMMGQMNLYMPQIVQNATNGLPITSPTMTTFCNQMATFLQNTGTGAGFGNYSAMFRNYTSRNSFWSNTGGMWQPGGMMGSGWGMTGMR